MYKLVCENGRDDDILITEVHPLLVWSGSNTEGEQGAWFFEYTADVTANMKLMSSSLEPINITSISEWRRRYRVIDFRSFRRPSLQAEVGWEFTIRDLLNDEEVTISGHVQVRWSHGKNFSKNCESKVYLDSDHSSIPGYDSL